MQLLSHNEICIINGGNCKCICQSAPNNTLTATCDITINTHNITTCHELCSALDNTCTATSCIDNFYRVLYADIAFISGATIAATLMFVLCWKNRF